MRMSYDGEIFFNGEEVGVLQKLAFIFGIPLNPQENLLQLHREIKDRIVKYELQIKH